MSTNPRMFQAAVAYVEKCRFAALPCHTVNNGRCSCGKENCASPAKHPCTKNGVKDATKDPRSIRQSWPLWSGANLGIATGSISQIVVLDVDPRNGGDASLAALETKYAKLPITPVVRTVGGGRHIYFRLKSGATAGNSASVLGAGLDVKGDNGYVIAPPSVHISGGRYRWSDSCGIDQVPIADPPDWLLDLLLKPSEPPGHTAGKGNPRKIPAGARNNTLYRLARGLKAKGFDREGILSALRVLNQSSCNPPLDDHEVCAIITHATEQPDDEGFTAASNPNSIESTGPYRATEKGLVRVEFRSTPDQPTKVTRPLTNFDARIIADISRDDGVELTRVFQIQAFVGGRPATFTVPSANFASMRWVPEHLGSQAVVFAGQGTADHALTAIQLLSPDPPCAHDLHAHWLA